LLADRALLAVEAQHSLHKIDQAQQTQKKPTKRQNQPDFFNRPHRFRHTISGTQNQYRKTSKRSF
jgi:hypothetical protein